MSGTTFGSGRRPIRARRRAGAATTTRRFHGDHSSGGHRRAGETRNGRSRRRRLRSQLSDPAQESDRGRGERARRVQGPGAGPRGPGGKAASGGGAASRGSGQALASVQRGGRGGGSALRFRQLPRNPGRPRRQGVYRGAEERASRGTDQVARG